MKEKIKRIYEDAIGELADELGYDPECDKCRGRGYVEYVDYLPDPPLGAVPTRKTLDCDCDIWRAEKEFLLWIAEEKFPQIWGEMEKEKKAM